MLHKNKNYALRLIHTDQWYFVLFHAEDDEQSGSSILSAYDGW